MYTAGIPSNIAATNSFGWCPNVPGTMYQQRPSLPLQKNVGGAAYDIGNPIGAGMEMIERSESDTIELPVLFVLENSYDIIILFI